MRKSLIFILCLVLLFGVGCSNQSARDTVNKDKININNEAPDDELLTKNLKLTVWGQLSSGQKAWIDGTWKDGKVSTVTLSEKWMNQVDHVLYEGREVYEIEFQTKSQSSTNNMIVYADINTFDYIGVGPVD
ncbi:hypothetical protein [Aquibacillus kalidii]|uniref:hypothetical protein n=1 Tax=Aquibacillus kalidii TaxID=2762597 RepID=UPI001645DC6E|nr:hypothetical protein [Aquibacillus kalidii]